METGGKTTGQLQLNSQVPADQAHLAVVALPVPSADGHRIADGSSHIPQALLGPELGQQGGKRLF